MARVLDLVEGAQRGERFGLDERCVAGEDEDVFVALDGVLRALDGVAGAALLGLLDEVDAR